MVGNGIVRGADRVEDRPGGEQVVHQLVGRRAVLEQRQVLEPDEAGVQLPVDRHHHVLGDRGVPAEVGQPLALGPGHRVGLGGPVTDHEEVHVAHTALPQQGAGVDHLVHGVGEAVAAGVAHGEAAARPGVLHRSEHGMVPVEGVLLGLDAVGQVAIAIRTQAVLEHVTVGAVPQGDDPGGAAEALLLDPLEDARQGVAGPHGSQLDEHQRPQIADLHQGRDLVPAAQRQGVQQREGMG